MIQTIKEIIMAAACFAYAFVRGAATGPTERPKRIVVVQLAKLGDMVCTTPMFGAIKRQYPEVHLTVVGSAANSEVLRYHPDVDEYIVFGGVRPMIRHLRAEPYDFGCLATPSMAALATLFLGGVRAIAVPDVIGGISPLETVSYNFTRMLVSVRAHHMGSYAPREYLRLLQPIGITTDDTKKTLRYTEAAKKKVDDFFKKHNLAGRLVVGISPSAGNKVKEWPPERFGAVADYLIERHGARVVIIGGPGDKRHAAAMRAAMTQGSGVVDTTSTLSIDELKALVSRLSLFIAVDTGPIYIAEAFGIPTVDIVGPMDEHEQPPQGPRHLVVVPPGARVPQLHIMSAHPHDEAEARRQTETISVGQVIAAAERLVA